ncbi:hypothetical protein EVG20_g6056 [Dentipellis fragilis]|uniref:Uncharacterized protein n=1 Tax=Dentipellis fragilis TaxID=205917 RepID=A0A4Y9YQZ2_9AGAM|nr:hypothetical protein EVG20_g6056 [Dentipellis fragilis]
MLIILVPIRKAESSYKVSTKPIFRVSADCHACFLRQVIRRQSSPQLAYTCTTKFLAPGYHLIIGEGYFIVRAKVCSDSKFKGGVAELGRGKRGPGTPNLRVKRYEKPRYWRSADPD